MKPSPVIQTLYDSAFALASPSEQLILAYIYNESCVGRSVTQRELSIRFKKLKKDRKTGEEDPAFRDIRYTVQNLRVQGAPIISGAKGDTNKGYRIPSDMSQAHKYMRSSSRRVKAYLHSSVVVFKAQAKIFDYYSGYMHKLERFYRKNYKKSFPVAVVMDRV